MLQRIAMVGRWKPVHLGHAAVLRGLVSSAAHVVVGIGSSNRFDLSNPFTASESADMIRLVIPTARNYDILEIPDLNDGPRWRAALVEILGDLDCFVTANPYVARLMSERYQVVHPVFFIPRSDRVAIDATMVRSAMLEGGAWRSLVPAVVARYLETHALVERFVREFGTAAAVSAGHGR